MDFSSWRSAFSERKFWIEAAYSVPLFVLVLWVLAELVAAVEKRPGARLADPVLALFQPIDVTWITFALIYGAILLALGDLIRDPWRLIGAFRAYALVGLGRALGMWMLALDPPEHMIVLRDPVVEFFSAAPSLTRDLFFSGHTSLMFLLFLLAAGKWRKTAFLLATAGVAGCVLAQHVHYTVDVFAAPFFTYGSWVLAQRLGQRPRAA